MSKEKININEVSFLSIILFFINPFLGIIITFNILYSKIKLNKTILIKLFIVFLALFLAFINSTKVPENDLLFHGGQYLQVKDFTFLGYLSYIKKEPIGYAFNYLFYYLSGGSIKFWVMTFSFFSYLLFFKAVKLFFIKIKAPNNQLLLGLILAAFFPQLFSLSAHLIRQFIASAIFIYFAVDKIFYKGNKWWLALIGVLTHGSSLILYAFVYFKFLGNFKKHKTVNILLIILLLSYQKVAQLLLLIIADKSSAIKYILERASEDTTFNLGGFQWLNFVMMIVMIVIALSSKKFIGRQFIKTRNQLVVSDEVIDNSNEERIELEKNVKFFFSIMIMFSFFILMNLSQSELSNRLFFYLFFYFPFVFPLFIARFKNSVLISYLVSVLFMFFFIYRLEYGVWHYASLFEIATNSVISFLLRTEPVI